MKVNTHFEQPPLILVKTYTFTKDEMQSLINAIFEMSIRMYSDEFKKCDRDEAMKWVADQLKHFGLETKPMGSSWGVLVG